MGGRVALLILGVMAWEGRESAAGVIRGVLRVPSLAAPAPAAISAYPGRAASMPNVAPVAHGQTIDAVISIERIPAAAESALAQRNAAAPRLAQKDQAFAPRVLAIAMGTTVEFPNLDPIFHNVFSISPIKRFDLGKYPRGQSRRVTFPKPGLVQVYCDIHASMAAYIVVLPNHAFARPDESGAYALPDLPGGEYQVNVWHPDFPELRRKVQVPESGDVNLDLSY
jgi:plastocyanin